MNRRPFKFDRVVTAAPNIDIEIRRACGHIEVIKSFTKDTNTPWFATQEQRDCRACYQGRTTDVDDRAVASGKRVELRGTGKQVAWAKTLRQKRAETFAKVWNVVQEQGKKSIAKNTFTQADVDAGIEALKVAIMDLMMGKTEWFVDDIGDLTYTSADARWWIDCRSMTDRQVLETLCETRDIGARRDPEDWTGLFIAKDVADDVSDNVSAAPIEADDVDELELDDTPF